MLSNSFYLHTFISHGTQVVTNSMQFNPSFQESQHITMPLSQEAALPEELKMKAENLPFLSFPFPHLPINSTCLYTKLCI